MPSHSPLPSSNFQKECAKAARIFTSFVQIIPNELLQSAKGFAILTVAKAGFLFSARAGSGLVIAKLQDGSWSAPSAIGTGGLGVGGQVGAELSEFVIILNSRAAVQSFMKTGSINIGGNLSVAVGPIGRNAEASGNLNKLAAMYSYSRTRGLFGGASLEGSVILERADANNKAYAELVDDEYGRWGGSGKGHQVTARQLLSGEIPSPPWAAALVSAIERCQGSEYSVQQAMRDAESDSDEDDRDQHNQRFRNSDGNRARGYSFGDEGKGHLSNDSYANDPEWNHAGVSVPQKKNRMRGYSLGNLGRSLSDNKYASPPVQKRRDRSWTTSNTIPQSALDRQTSRDGVHFADYDDYDDDARRADYEDFSMDPDAVRARRRRGFSSPSDNSRAPPSPGGSTNSKNSPGARFKDFMTRPVMPARRSTTTASDIKRAERQREEMYESPKRDRSASKSGLGFGAFSRSSRRNNESPAFDESNGGESGRYSSSSANFGTTFRSATPDSFDDDDDDPYRAGRSNRSGRNSPYRQDSDDRRNVGEGSFSLSDFNAGQQGAIGSGNGKGKDKKRLSVLSRSANALLSARPGANRASSTPMPRRNAGRNTSDDEERADYFSSSSRRKKRQGEEDVVTSQPSGFGDEYDDHLRVARGEVADPFGDEVKESSLRSSSRQPASNTSSRTSSPGGLASERTSAGHPQQGSAFFNERDRRNLLDTLDEDEDDRHLREPSPLSSSHEPVQPRHRLDVEASDGDDARSLHSLDSEDEFAFGQQAIRLPKAARNGQSPNGPAGRRLPPAPTFASKESKGEWVIAIFDFQGGESTDLSFSKGEVIEIIGKEDADWWMGRNSAGQTGIIPVNRTQLYKP